MGASDLLTSSSRASQVAQSERK
ncbi:TPA: hypothetical protein N0F65_010664 [Lagenidium giganteum]|uniref:Uncharacterized protein n=1 Tax=Lagenidium giganteum TaxID=4803 RepID=A0AAV2Z8V4_9STRA|nr:TPA: hypothetical protein N0F65_010664 [Lagenidium giganteum]